MESGGDRFYQSQCAGAFWEVMGKLAGACEAVSFALHRAPFAYSLHRGEAPDFPSLPLKLDIITLAFLDSKLLISN